MTRAAVKSLPLAAGVAVAVLASVWGWWAATDGAYFGTVMYPGLIVLCAGLILVSSRAAWPARLEVSLGLRIAVGCLVALGAWSALSALWSPTPDIADADAQRILGYAVALGLGLWLRVLLGERPDLAMAPLALAALFAGVLTVGGLLTGSEFAKYAEEGTLRYPLGYRNANAAFFLIALWPAIGLAANRRLDWRLRALSLGTATLCLELAILSQSRASVIAGAVALVTFLVLAPERARWTGWLVLAVVPAVAVVPAMIDLYDTAELVGYRGTAELRDAGWAAAGGVGLALIAGAVAAFAGRRLREAPRRRQQADRAVTYGAVALVVGAVVAFTVATDRPIGWIGDRADEFFSQGTPESEGTASRFTANAGSERDDLWRVALDDATEDPLLGLGGGGYQYSYLQDRREEGIESVRDAHSLELEVLSELGFPGLLLLAFALTAAFAAALRSRAAGPASAALAAVAVTAGAYWLAHASFDWFWAYPAVTAPVLALLGSCWAPARSSEGTRAGRWRLVIAGGAVALALTVIPPFLAQRYVNGAFAGWQADPGRALSDLDRARDLNPLSIEPLLARGGIERALGNRDAAIAAFEEAAEERPEEWATYYFLALLTLNSDPESARTAIDRARSLNPFSPRVKELSRRVARAERRATS
jgi:O-antigen ligase